VWSSSRPRYLPRVTFTSLF